MISNSIQFNSLFWKGISLLCFLFLIGVGSGCEELTGVEEEGKVLVYNLDNEHAYRVELYFAADHILAGSLYLDNYPDDGYEDSFEGIAEDFYYLSIFKDDSTSETGRSATFHVGEDDMITLTIENDWNVDNY